MGRIEKCKELESGKNCEWEDLESGKKLERRTNNFWSKLSHCQMVPNRYNSSSKSIKKNFCIVQLSFVCNNNTFPIDQ